MPRLLFARAGWMRFYNGPMPGDERPIGDAAYIQDNIGGEVYNFHQVEGNLYGFIRPPARRYEVNLRRIDNNISDEAKQLDKVLVVFVATRRGIGQVIVGWYSDAVVFRQYQENSPGIPEGFRHFCWAEAKNCVLLPVANRTFEIPRARGGMVQANVRYALQQNGQPDNAEWMHDALVFIENYNGSNLLAEPWADADEEGAAAIEAARAQSQGRGFADTPEARKAIEDLAMAAATQYFSDKNFVVEDVSARERYDLLCTQNEIELHVEVKGTTTAGETIIVTYNEVEHAQAQRNRCALFVLHSITLNGQEATGGDFIVVDPWQPQQDRLKPVCYTYRLPNGVRDRDD